MQRKTNRKMAFVALLLTLAVLFISCTAVQSTGVPTSKPNASSSTTSSKYPSGSTSSSSSTNGGSTNQNGIVSIDLYVTNDLHGIVNDTTSASGIAKTATKTPMQFFFLRVICGKVRLNPTTQKG